MINFCRNHNYRVLLIDGWCGVCTARNEIRSQSYQHVCYCPRCYHKTDHKWAGITFLDDNGKPLVSMRIIRQCSACKYQWRQS